jgi:hypothetical protein
MFGKKFWSNAILAATHWNYGKDNIRQDMTKSVTIKSLMK